MELFISSDRSDDRVFVGAALAVVAFMVLFFLESKVYDLATAAFFAFGLGLMAREKLSEYFALFAFASVNRETSFLLIGVFIVYFVCQAKGVRASRARTEWIVGSVLYQAFIFGVVRVCLMVIFAENPGSDFLFQPLRNLDLFLHVFPLGSLVHWGLFAAIIWLCIRRWKAQPLVLRAAFAVLMPALTMMYLLLGVAFEIRVFAEVFPVVWVMMAGEGVK